MKARKLLIGSLAVLGTVALPVAAAHGLQVKVSINFGPTLVGPDNGTLIVTANPGDLLLITWALGTDTDILRYTGLIGPVDTTEISRDVGSALELTGQGFDRSATRTSPIRSSSITRGRTGLPSVSPATMVSCGGSNTP